MTPPSTDTSTPPTTPPTSVAVPVIVTTLPACTVDPAVGDVIVDVGAATSVEAVAATRPDCSEPGSACISAKRLTVACLMATSGVELPSLWLPSRPHD